MPAKTRTSEIARSWDRNATTWARHVRGGGDLTRTHIIDPAILALTGDVAGLDVLDAGCGEGSHARQLARAGARVVGVDISAAMIREARAEEARAPLGISYRIGDVARLVGVADASVDLGLLSMILMGLPNPERVLAGVTRVLRPAGRLLVVINHPCFTGPDTEDYFASSASRWRFYDGQEAETRFYHRTLATYAHALRAAGLVLVDVHEPVVSRSAARRHRELAVHLRVPLVIVLECERRRVAPVRASTRRAT